MLSSPTDRHPFPNGNRFGCTYIFFLKMTNAVKDGLIETNKGRHWLEFNVLKQNKTKTKKEAKYINEPRKNKLARSGHTQDIIEKGKRSEEKDRESVCVSE